MKDGKWVPWLVIAFVVLLIGYIFLGPNANAGTNVKAIVNGLGWTINVEYYYRNATGWVDIVAENGTRYHTSDHNVVIIEE